MHYPSIHLEEMKSTIRILSQDNMSNGWLFSRVTWQYKLVEMTLKLQYEVQTSV
jgi:hypothetical protein